MDVVVDQQQSSDYKHFCKICQRGFICGRALGGHMRAHGAGDENGNIDDEYPGSSDREDKLGETKNGKHMYSLRTNPNRGKRKVCDNCGKEFSSWNAFLEHGPLGKCTSSEDAESLVSSPLGSPDIVGGGGGDEERDDSKRTSCGWSKRKRTLRAEVGSTSNFSIMNNCPSSEEEDLALANCLMLLSNAGGVDPLETDNNHNEHEESCASANKDHHDQDNILRRSSINFLNIHHANHTNHANSLVVPQMTTHMSNMDYKAKSVLTTNNTSSATTKGLFECKACKKVFTSHQALGGHRASHKKVKGCFAARLDQVEQQDASYGDDQDMMLTNNDQDHQLFPSSSSPNGNPNTMPSSFDNGNFMNSPLTMSKRKSSKVHECSICHRIFSSGQALGGHKRCHWITSNAPDTSTLARFQQLHDQINEHMQDHQRPIFSPPPQQQSEKALDLNLPAPNDLDVLGLRRNNINSTALSLKVSTEFFLRSWEEGAGAQTNKEEHQHHERHQKQVQTDQQDVDLENHEKNIIINSTNNNNMAEDITKKNTSSYESMQVNVDDEADSKLKLAKLSELKDMNTTSGASSPWLQVGIGSSNGAVEDDT